MPRRKIKYLKHVLCHNITTRINILWTDILVINNDNDNKRQLSLNTE